MCSIAGIFTAQRHATGTLEAGNLAHSLAQMTRALQHRGPDAHGLWWRNQAHGPAVGLGNTRLAILDLSPAGQMPMTHGATVLSYNGETYNFQSIKREIESTSEVRNAWRSHTDTEVVLRAYQTWGAAAWPKLRGMFAAALWDETPQELILARDAFGIKPVYYYQTKDLFIFASEVRALLVSGLVPRRLNRDGAATFLHYGAVDEPTTIIEGVRAVRPGHYLTVKLNAGKVTVSETPWAADALPQVPAVRTRAEAVKELREILRESVRLHLVSDVPLGVFLSGGIDSSAIVALMSEVTHVAPRTFSVVFDEQKLSEESYAALVAAKFRTEHKVIRLTGQDLEALLPDALGALDQPSQDAVNTFVVSQAVKAAGLTVALSGLGGDELFAGYPSFTRARKMATAARVPRLLRRAAATAAGVWLDDSITSRKTRELLAGDGQTATTVDLARQLFLSEEVKRLLGELPPKASEKLWPVSRAGRDVVNAVSLHELQHYMANTLLRDTDSMSMAHSLEVRVPFVDLAVASFVVPLPGAWKLAGSYPKPLLVDALGDLLPPEIVNRPKMGFTLPFAQWLQTTLRVEVERILTDDTSLQSWGLNAPAVREVWRRFLAAPHKVGWTRPWALFVLARWCARHEVVI